MGGVNAHLKGRHAVQSLPVSRGPQIPQEMGLAKTCPILPWQIDEPVSRRPLR